MTKCIVRNCKNNSNFKDPNSTISFHRVPKNELIFRDWMKGINNEDRNLKFKPTMRICSLHFLPSDFLVIGSKKYLKPYAIPSIENPPKVPIPSIRLVNVPTSSAASTSIDFSLTQPTMYPQVFPKKMDPLSSLKNTETLSESPIDYSESEESQTILLLTRVSYKIDEDSSSNISTIVEEDAEQNENLKRHGEVLNCRETINSEPRQKRIRLEHSYVITPAKLAKKRKSLLTKRKIKNNKNTKLDKANQKIKSLKKEISTLKEIVNDLKKRINC